jgi:serine/threonine protein phosphatase PrpC
MQDSSAAVNKNFISGDKSSIHPRQLMKSITSLKQSYLYYALAILLISLFISFHFEYYPLNLNVRGNKKDKYCLNNFISSAEMKGRRSYMEDNHSILIGNELYLSNVSFHSEYAQIFNDKNPYNFTAISLEETLCDNNHIPNYPINHDNLLDKEWILLGVYDGHGGAAASAFTSVYLLPNLYTQLANYTHYYPNEADWDQFHMKELIEKAFIHHDASYKREEARLRPLKLAEIDNLEGLDLHTRDLMKRRIALYSDGSTVLVIALNTKKNIIVSMNLGDCRALVIGDLFFNHTNVLNIEESSGYNAITRGLHNIYQAILNIINPQRVSSRNEDHSARFPPVSVDSDYDKDDGITESELQDMLHNYNAEYASTATYTYLPLSVDHKPHLPAELNYIESAGGFITRRGVSRVNGNLAVSRAVGDFSLKPIVRNEPETKIYPLQQHQFNSKDLIDSATMKLLRHDRYIFVASDGFFDVFTNEQVVLLVNQFRNQGLSLKASAKILMKLAYERGSSDNVTVLIVDLQQLMQH